MSEPSPHLITRQTLLERVQNDADHPQWDEWLVFYEDFITALLYRMGFRHSNLEDAKQQVFLKIWQVLPQYKRGAKVGHFRSWLISVVRNAALDWRRLYKEGKMKTVELEQVDGEWLKSEDPMDECIDREWKSYIVNKAMEGLMHQFSAKALELFMRSLEGQDMEQICKDLQIQKNSAYVMRSRVRSLLNEEISRLRKKLEGESGLGV